MMLSSLLVALISAIADLPHKLGKRRRAYAHIVAILIIIIIVLVVLIILTI
jgi:t-SNARE complex subunit (syntaxin)